MKTLVLISIAILFAGCGGDELDQSQKDSLKKLQIADSIASAKADKDKIANDRKHKGKDTSAIDNANTVNIQENTAQAVDMPNDVEAEQMAHILIKAQSVDPDNVEFIDANAKMAKYADSSFVFVGYVKMPNEYSMKVTKEYNVGIKWNGGEWNDDKSWTVKFCNLNNLSN